MAELTIGEVAQGQGYSHLRCVIMKVWDYSQHQSG